LLSVESQSQSQLVVTVQQIYAAARAFDVCFRTSNSFSSSSSSHSLYSYGTTSGVAWGFVEFGSGESQGRHAPSVMTGTQPSGWTGGTAVAW